MVNKPYVLVVIPARFHSTRLEGKPLKLIGGKPVIEHVYNRAKEMKTADRVIVATDDDRIVEAVKNFGGESMLTSKRHRSGTDRSAEVAQLVKADIVVNLQGDEPFINPGAVDMAVNSLMENPELKVATLCVPISPVEAEDPNVTCVVRDLAGYALYFSKLHIPNDRDGDADKRPLYKHLGIYVFRSDFLVEYAALEPTPLEKCEKLEQLRILENGERIMVVETDCDSIGVDSPEDLKKANEIFSNG
ncbi:3-deoxy-manno-octulosonate cytidylyltransferase [hydrothermal vent metagenome]|uniref:3-deoxy-manno-octulosonate cytidylyltransferase n=1 Tax=hydrothermal vent metagenome TaxID=652676 RepID=A0A3B1BJI3_9ZZZZ